MPDETLISAYDPANWYWRADDGRVFSSKAGAVVPATDAAFVAWTAAGNFPTPWPRDTAGGQTSADLQWVFDNAGLKIVVDPSAVVVPTSVSKAQGKIQLLRAGKLDAVQAAVTAAGGEIAIWFSDAPTWERTNPHLEALGTTIGLSSSDIDQMFIAAAQIAA